MYCYADLFSSSRCVSRRWSANPPPFRIILTPRHVKYRLSVRLFGHRVLRCLSGDIRRDRWKRLAARFSANSGEFVEEFCLRMPVGDLHAALRCRSSGGRN